MNRAIIHVDMDAFFAAVEEQRHPEYKGKPLIVGGRGDPRQRGVVSTANYEARRFGIESGMPLRVAYRKCPQAIFLPVDFKKYREISEKIKKILREYSPVVESWGLDEAFLDVTGLDRKATEIAVEIKKRIKSEVGLTATIGVASNKLLAKMASSMNKPDGLTVLLGKNTAKILSSLPVSRLLWVGRKTTTRLNALGIKTIGDLRKMSLERLTQNFGQALGKMLYNYARGIDESPVVSYREPKSMSRETTFQTDIKNIRLIKNVLWQFAQVLEKRLKREGFKGKTVTVKIRYKSFVTHTHSQTLAQAVASASSIYETSLRLLNKFDFQQEVRLVGLCVSNLIKR